MVVLKNSVIVASLFLLTASNVFAVEEISVVKKYALVGIIANGTSAKKHKGIAVIKDTVSKRSLTVSVGDFLPYSTWKVQAVERDRILVSNGKEQEEVRYNLTDEEPTKSVAKNDEDAVTAEDIDVDNSEVVSQRAWENFYKNRDTTGDFDRKVTIVVAEPGTTVEARPHTPQAPRNYNEYPGPAPRSQSPQLSEADEDDEQQIEMPDGATEPLIYPAPH